MKLKSFIAGVLFGISLLISTSVFASSQEISALITNFTFKINGQEVQFETQPIVYEGRSYLPVRFVEELGFKVNFDNSTKTVEFINDDFEYVSKGVRTSIEGDEAGDKIVQVQDRILVDGLSTMFLNNEGKLDLERIKKAVESGEIHVDSQDSKTGETLTILAAKQNNYFVIQYMHSKGANLDLADFDGKTPVHHAVIENNLSALSGLVQDFGATPNLKDNNGLKPIDYTDSKFSSAYIGLIKFEK